MKTQAPKKYAVIVKEDQSMKKLQNQLKTVSKSLAKLAGQVEKISQQINQAQPAQKAAPKGKPAAKKAAPAGGKTVLDSVYDVIKRSKNGVSVGQLKAKTQLDSRQLSNALYKLSKKGQVYAKSRGLYMKK
jgi:predicted Rossmann fold nucleotide-binding protein DprA/Smf involved in DNA uptake